MNAYKDLEGLISKCTSSMKKVNNKFIVNVDVIRHKININRNSMRKIDEAIDMAFSLRDDQEASKVIGRKFLKISTNKMANFEGFSEISQSIEH